MAEDEKKTLNTKVPVQRATAGKTATKKATLAKKAAASAATKTPARSKAPAAPRSKPTPRPAPAAPKGGGSPQSAASSHAPAAAPRPRLPLEEKPTDRRAPVPASPEGRDAMIREAAYFKAESRNFDPSFDAQNWAEAEREVDERLSRGEGTP